MPWNESMAGPGIVDARRRAPVQCLYGSKSGEPLSGRRTGPTPKACNDANLGFEQIPDAFMIRWARQAEALVWSALPGVTWS